VATFSTNEFKSGLKIMINGDPHNIVENEFVKPGKGQAFSRVRVRNLKTGRVVEKTFKSGETVEAADVFETEVQYLYNDGEFWHFMHPESYEQYSIAKEAIGDSALWMQEEGVEFEIPFQKPVSSAGNTYYLQAACCIRQKKISLSFRNRLTHP